MSCLLTYRDLTEHLLDYLAANPGGDAGRDTRRAAIAGLQSLARAAQWRYFQASGRVVTVASVNTGTVSYEAATRQLSLFGSTWPAWAARGTVVLSDIRYPVAARLDDLTLELSLNTNPGIDIDPGATFTLYRDTYSLPNDCVALDQPHIWGHSSWLCYDSPGAWLNRQANYTGTSTPASYCVRGDPEFIGAMAMSLFPPPDQAYEVAFVYNRTPRPMRLESYSAGRVSLVATSDTVTGTATVFAERLHRGSVLRVSADAQTLPTSDVGDNPAVLERVVASVDGPTQLTLDEPSDVTLSGVAYLLSDPADVEPLAMRTALFRACEYQLAIARNRRDKAEIEQEWVKELVRAREADSRNFAPQQAGAGGVYWPRRLADMPYDPGS